VAVTESRQFTIGAEANATDGVCGVVSRVIVDPIARAVTHLVVEPKHSRDVSRLVPLDLLDTAPTGEVRLRCTVAEFEKLDVAQETHFLLGDGYPGYGPDQMLSWPYYLGPGMAGMDVGIGLSQTVTSDTVPMGEVAIRRGEHVHATDGEIGRVQGLVIAPTTRHVTHVLLQEGHLWGLKNVAIPIRAVAGVEHGIRLNITKQQVEDLPPVDLPHRRG
jgi:sporulation protein YlmC with PRC-barrel domain